jgi:hypothetical protein
MVVTVPSMVSGNCRGAVAITAAREKDYREMPTETIIIPAITSV